MFVPTAVRPNFIPFGALSPVKTSMKIAHAKACHLDRLGAGPEQSRRIKSLATLRQAQGKLSATLRELFIHGDVWQMPGFVLASHVNRRIQPEVQATKLPTTRLPTSMP
jgi:hypothetical protein